MKNFLLATPALSDAGTITGSESMGDMTIGNLQSRSLKRLYRTANLSAEINIDLGAAREIDLVSLIAHNGGGTVTVRAGSTSAVSDFTSGALDLITGTDSGQGSNMFLLKMAPQTYRYWRLTISDSSNPAGYFQAGRIYLSKAFQPVVNMDYGAAGGWRDDSKVVRTLSGEPIPLVRTPRRVEEFVLSFGSEAEMYGTIYDIERLRGVSKDVLYINDPEATTYMQRRSIYGLMGELSPVVNVAFQLFQKKFIIEEIPA
jgi:hypothetical protein